MSGQLLRPRMSVRGNKELADAAGTVGESGRRSSADHRVKDGGQR